MAAKRNPQDATRPEVAELRRRVKLLESKVALLAKMLLKLSKGAAK